MLEKILYITGLIVIVIVMVIACLEFFSSYPTQATEYNSNAPVQSVKSTAIHASPEKVWTILIKGNERQTRHMDNKTSALKRNFKTDDSFPWRFNGLSIRSDIKIAEPYSKIVWSGQAFGRFVIHIWTFKPLRGGYTRVDVRESMEGWLVKLFAHKFQTGLDASLDKWLASLKIEAEK